MTPILFCLGLVCSSFVHEAGHVLAATLLGFRLRMVNLGVGPSVAKARFGKVWLVLRAIPVSGSVGILPDAAQGRLPWAIFLSAGAGANAAALLGLHALHKGQLLSSAVVAPLAFAQIASVANLVPFRLWQSIAGVRESDGWHLLALLLGRRPPGLADTEARFAAVVIREGAAFPPSSTMFAEILYQLLRLTKGTEAWEAHDALRTLRGLLGDAALRPHERATVLALMIDTQRHRGDLGLRPEELDAWSREAIELFPVPLIRTSRSVVLLSQGRPAEAASMARGVLADVPCAEVAAICEAVLDEASQASGGSALPP